MGYVYSRESVKTEEALKHNLNDLRAPLRSWVYLDWHLVPDAGQKRTLIPMAHLLVKVM